MGPETSPDEDDARLRVRFPCMLFWPYVPWSTSGVRTVVHGATVCSPAGNANPYVYVAACSRVAEVNSMWLHAAAE